VEENPPSPGVAGTSLKSFLSTKENSPSRLPKPALETRTEAGDKEDGLSKGQEVSVGGPLESKKRLLEGGFGEVSRRRGDKIQ